MSYAATTTIASAAAIACLLTIAAAGRPPRHAGAPLLAATVEIQLRHQPGPREHYGFAERRQRSRYA